MNKGTLAALAFVAALNVGTAAAQSAQPAPATPAPSINQADGFLGLCQKPENRDTCLTYLSGYSNGVLVRSLIDKQRPRYCIPQNVTLSTQLAVVTAYMKAHLENILEPTAAVVYKALLGTYPCK